MSSDRADHLHLLNKEEGVSVRVVNIPGDGDLSLEHGPKLSLGVKWAQLQSDELVAECSPSYIPPEVVYSYHQQLPSYSVCITIETIFTSLILYNHLSYSLSC